MNRGLKNYTKQIQENVNNVIINVNLNEEDNNNLSKLYKGEKVMEDYVKDAKIASISDDVVGLYDKELHEELLRNTELYNAEQKGIKQGIKENKLETAKALLKEKISIDIISRTTGLKKEEIEKLK